MFRKTNSIRKKKEKEIVHNSWVPVDLIGFYQVLISLIYVYIYTHIYVHGGCHDNLSSVQGHLNRKVYYLHHVFRIRMTFFLLVRSLKNNNIKKLIRDCEENKNLSGNKI